MFDEKALEDQSSAPITWLGCRTMFFVAVAAVLLITATLLLNAPAEILQRYSRLPDDSQWRGSVGQGQLITTDGAVLKWSVNRAGSVMRLRPHADWQAEAPGARLSGKLTASRRIVLEDLNGRLAAEALAKTAGVSLRICELSVRLSGVRLEQTAASWRVDGEASTAGGKCNDRDIPSMRLVAKSASGATIITVREANGTSADPLVDAVLSGEGKIEITLSPLGSAIFMDQSVSSDTVLEFDLPSMASHSR